MLALNDFPVPLLGFAAYSGTGKTTLLTQVIPLLTKAGYHIALVKHSHHNFEIDHPKKDSYELRKAGAEQVVIASKERIAWIAELQEEKEEPSLQEALQVLQLDSLDLVLVEGFKNEAIPKIELHRQSLARPYLHRNDANIIAIASDEMPAQKKESLKWLDINDIQQVSGFIQTWLESRCDKD
ncbi:MAG TPA: molybdopterin-guanine dinucleotide biosynthesis protein B [Leucothrix mucor]|nr:molybdopterin-guanine dinucleotide biosynthesis protein B [Leucothrix mucor]